MNNTLAHIYNDINNSDIYIDSLLVIFIFIISAVLAVICVMSFLFYSYYNT